MSMIMCPECGTHLSNRARTCPYCGFVSDNPALPIGLQDSYVPTPTIKLEIQRWNPSSKHLDTKLVDTGPYTNKVLMFFLGDWNQVKTMFPAISDLLKKLAEKESGTRWIAKIPEYYAEKLAKGEFTLKTDKNGETLCSLYDGKGKFVKQFRLEAENIPTDMTPQLQQIQTQAALSTVLAELQTIQENLQEIQVDLQNDRYALADSAWNKLAQARAITDGRLRDAYVLEAISAATDAKSTLMRNFSERREYLQEHT